MAATIATKVDLQLLRQDLIAALPSRDEVAAIRSDVSSLRDDLTSLRSDQTSLRGEVASLRSDVALVRKDVEILATRMTVRLGSMLIVGLGLLFAALQLS